MKLIIFVQLFYRDYERSRDFRGGGGASQPVSQSVCHQPHEPVLVDWPTHDFRQLYQLCQ